MIKIEKINKIFKIKEEEVKALDNVSFEIKKSEIFALLGPNGAGKTTLIKVLCGLLQPTSGNVSIEGKKIEANLGKIGVMFGETMLYRRMTGYDNLKYFAKIYEVKNYKERIREISKLIGIGSWINNYVETYSTGMRSKLALARALIHEPEILFLDEPTFGLDPAVTLEIQKRIKAMNKTIILTTHNMQEASFLADRIGILNHGKLVKVGTLKELKKSVKKPSATLLDIFIKLTGEKL